MGNPVRIFQASEHYDVEADSATAVDVMLAQLPAFPKMVLVDRNGGLMTHLSVWKN